MAKDPVLPLYYNDLTTSTQDWSDEEFGAYVRLLIHQWRQGGLPKDYQRLTRIATSLDRNWPLLKSKFVEVDDLLMNEYMELVRAKRVKHKQKQKENVEKRYQTSTKQPTKSIPLEIEIEKEIEKEDKEGVQGKPSDHEVSDQLEIFELIFTDERFVEMLRMNHPGKDYHRGFNECFAYFSNRPNPPNMLWQWREKLLTWLSNMKPEKNGKQTTKDKSTEHLSGLMEGFKRRNGGTAPGG